MLQEFQEEKEKTYDDLLSKYSIIWIWSIIVGINTTIGFSLYEYNSRNYGFLGLPNIALSGIAAFCCIASWLNLYKVLRLIILPQLFNQKRASKPLNNNLEIEDMEKILSGNNNINAYYISNALRYLIFALMFKYIAVIADHLLNSLAKY